MGHNKTWFAYPIKFSYKKSHLQNQLQKNAFPGPWKFMDLEHFKGQGKWRDCEFKQLKN